MRRAQPRMIEKLSISVGFLFAALLLPARASAQDLEKHSWALGVERLYGITGTTDTVRPPGGKVKTSTFNYSLFSNPAGSQRTVYSAPRLVADFLITQRWSAGLGAGIFGGKTSTKSEAGDVDGPTVLGFTLAPRLGYLLVQNSWFAFWPKAGLTYTNSSAKTDNAQVSQFRGALSVEASALLLPGEHIILSFTPTFDGGIFGANSSGGGDNIRATALEYGFQGGLGVYF